jgi:hypothetical protein
MRLVVAQLIQNFDFSLVEGCGRKPELLETLNDLGAVSYPKGALNVKVVSRSI